jgi:ArsR family transcriptional regulator, arsenate/arsenite/antimonite-responsive transcriptional repressor / arsenate reductase (thioredoxin)
VHRVESGPEKTSQQFLRLTGEPVRWQLLRELARSDRQVHELIGLLGRPQSLVSYHLGRLRSAGLISARRSSADGRDAYYAVNLTRYGELLAEAARSVHPGLQLVAGPRGGPAGPPGAAAGRLLFLCTGNSARSQIAEALAADRSGGLVRARSAGSRPKPLHANAIRVMRDYGIDLGSRRPKHLSLFAGDQFDYVITLCDRVREVCPEFPGGPARIHWSIPDPAASGDDDAATLPAFRQTAAEVETRVLYLLAGIGALPARESR